MPVLQKNKDGLIEVKTIESERYEKTEDNIHVRKVGMIKAQDAFDQLKTHLEKVGLLPDEYFIMSHRVKPDMELPDFSTAICHTDWGGSEGIYIDIDLVYYDMHRQQQHLNLATGKTLGSTGDDFLKMSRIAAECSIMLNGRGLIVRVSEAAYDNVQLTQTEKALIAKALDSMGDKAADSEGYSAGEAYWNLKEKFDVDQVQSQEEVLIGRASGFVEVYKLVKEARLAEPVNTKALNDIRDKYGYDLYKEALDVVLKEMEKPSLSSQIQTAEAKSAKNAPNTTVPTKTGEKEFKLEESDVLVEGKIDGFER